MLQATTVNQTSTPTTSTNSLPLISNFSTIDLLIVTVLITLILVSIIGNCLVCVAIFTDRRLRKLGNAFIVSLAIADLFVSCLVMTFALCNDLMNYWIFGDWFCDVWISFDIMCCTASILNLCAISLDRFIHIKDCLLYNQLMTKKVAISAVIIIWFISALVSFVPINLGWHKPDYRFGGSSSSWSSVVSVVKDASLPMYSHHDNHHNQQQQQQQQYVRYRKRASNQQTTTFDANFQLKHSISIPSGTLITSSFERQVPSNSLFGTESSQQGAKLNYLSSKDIEFPFHLANNRERTTAEAAIEPIENQSLLHPETSRQNFLASTKTGNDRLSHQDFSVRSKRNDNILLQTINRIRQRRDLVSSYSSGSSNHYLEKPDGLAFVASTIQPSSSLRPEIDSSGLTAAAAAATTKTKTKTTSTTNKSKPLQKYTKSLQSSRPQSNKVETNPLDRSQIELDPPKAWLLELEQEAARKAISSSSTSSSTSRRQVNLAPSPSAALRLSRLPELTDEDEDETTATATATATAITIASTNNNNVDLTARQQQLMIIQDQNLGQAVSSTSSATTESMSKISHLPDVNNNSNNDDNSNNPQLPLCILTLTPTYAVISSTISFYIPCIIMLGLYTKLFACARKHVRNIQAISKAPAPISVRTTNLVAASVTATSTTSATSTSPAGQQQHLEKFENNNNNNNKGRDSSRCGSQQAQRERQRRFPKIAMLECRELSNPSPIRTWLKFGCKQQQKDIGEKVNEKYPNAQLHDKSQSKNTIFSHIKNGAKESVVPNETAPGNELVELARFTASNSAKTKQETQDQDQNKHQYQTQQQQLSETSRMPANDLGLSEVLNNDHQQRSSSSLSLSPSSSASASSAAAAETTTQHNRAEERYSEVVKRIQMPQLDHKKQPPDEKCGKNKTRKSLISSENERVAALSLGRERKRGYEGDEEETAAAVEEQLPFLASSQEMNNRKRSSKQASCAPQFPGNARENPTTKMINFSNQMNFQQQQQQQSGQQLATHKAAITLGIIMGTFLFCWVPFFCLNITKAFCVDCIPSSVFRFFTWLGYANSALNPIIYGIHNSEFRNAFNRIFFKHLNIKNSRYYLNRRFSYDLRQQSAHNNHHHHHQMSLQRKDRLRGRNNNNSNNQKSVDSRQPLKCCKVEALA